jgi:hypothetical protein
MRSGRWYDPSLLALALQFPSLRLHLGDGALALGLAVAVSVANRRVEDGRQKPLVVAVGVVGLAPSGEPSQGTT